MRNSTFLLVLFFIIACGGDKSEDKRSQEEIDARANIIHDSTIAEERKLFLEKYNPSSISDSTFKYTYQLQEILFNTNGYHRVKGNIVDIVIKDGLYFLKIAGVFSRHITFLELSINSDILEKINEIKYENEKVKKADFVFELTNFETSTGLKADPFDSGNSYFDIKYDFLSVTYFIRGELVDLLPSN